MFLWQNLDPQHPWSWPKVTAVDDEEFDAEDDDDEPGVSDSMVEKNLNFKGLSKVFSSRIGEWIDKK